VTAFALSDTMPPGGGVHGRPFSNMRIAGRPPLAEQGGMVAFRYVTPGYFRVLGIPILAGRDFEERERSAADTPVILSATLARRMFGSENPVGQRIDLDANGHWLPIVGVVGDVKNSGLAEPTDPEYYRLRTYGSAALGRDAVVLLKTPLDPSLAAQWVRRQFAAVDSGVPVNVIAMPEPERSECAPALRSGSGRPVRRFRATAGRHRTLRTTLVPGGAAYP
jgi:hypothetical protein